MFYPGEIPCNNCDQHELEKAFISQWDFPSHYYFNDRLEFCEIFKIKRINNFTAAFAHIYQGCPY